MLDTIPMIVGTSIYIYHHIYPYDITHMISLSHRAIAFTLPVTTRHLVLWLGRIPNQVGWAPKLTTNQRDSLFYLTEGRRFHPSPLPSCPNSMHLPAEKTLRESHAAGNSPWLRWIMINLYQSIAIYSGHKWNSWLVVLTILKNMSSSMGRIIPSAINDYPINF